MTHSLSQNSALINATAQLLLSLKKGQMFADLGDELITNLVNTMTISVIHGGEFLFNQGDLADSLWIVISGRLLVSLQLPDGSRKRLGEIGPGSSVGEVGMILNQPRTADAIAIRDSSVARLTRGQFETLLRLYPIDLNRAIIRTMFEFSQNNALRPTTIGATTFTIVPLNSDVDTSQLCQEIKRALSQIGSVKFLSATEGDKLSVATDESVQSTAHLNELGQNFDYLLFESTAAETPWSHMAVRQADHVILVASPKADPQTLVLADHLITGSSITMVRKSLIILHPPTTKTPTVNLDWHQTFELTRIYPIRRDCIGDIDRLVRFITDRAVGLVLGGGGARGLAHIGVLQALDEAGIVVDMVCGNSMGALIGAQYVYGTPIKDLLATTRAFVRGGESLTLPLFSLLSGHRVRRDLRRMFDTATIEALWQPFFAISCNLSSANIKVHDQGPLWQAILASNSPAGILPPVIIDGELLVDAALLDNIPVEAMRNKLGFGTLIAIDVDVREELKVDPSLKQLSGWQVLRQRLFRRNEARLPGIIDLLDRVGHLGGLARRSAAITMADHYWQPPVSKFALMGYGKGEEIVATGYHYAKQQITRWQRGEDDKNE